MMDYNRSELEMLIVNNEEEIRLLKQGMIESQKEMLLLEEEIARLKEYEWMYNEICN